MVSDKKFYITTPIYYPSGKWHLGSAYTTVLADAVSRFKRMDGYDVFFLTGTDEHGMKIEKRAAESNQQPKEFVDGIVANLKELWSVMDISYDKFIRTTDEEHTTAVKKIFTKLYEKGDIYKSTYEGWYCVPCESFWTDTQVEGEKCPDCGRPIQRSSEESYFFRLSKYADKLLELYEQNAEFLLPKSRVNEMVNNFIKPGLADLAVSRTSFKWGIPVPFDEKHIIYVWVDALTNYITALGYGSDDTTLFEKFWPCNVHLMAKEIVRFHSIIWPSILMALDIPVPKMVYGHGWLMMGGDKLSKSKSGNIKKDVVDPFVLCQRYSADSVRYVLLKEGPYAGDTPYTNETLLSTVNSDLANDLGNLLSRTTAMITQYFNAVVPELGELNDLDKDVISLATSLYAKCEKAMEKSDLPTHIHTVMSLVRRANKYIDETMPWALAKSEDGRDRLKNVMYILAESLRISAILLKPVLTKYSDIMLSRLGITEFINDFDSVKDFGGLKSGSVVTKGDALFPRLDIKKEQQFLEELAMMEDKKVAEQKTQETAEEKKANINIDDFAKINLRTAKVIDCEKVEKSDKLLKLTVEVGEEIRTVVSGIAKHYTPEDMKDRTVVLVANLAPVKLRGILSEGMILCAEDKDGKLSLVQPDSIISSGSEVR